MRLARRTWWERYGFSLASVVAVVLLKSAANYCFGPGPPLLLLFLLAVMAAAWYGGLRPGLTAMALSVLICTYFYLEPVYSLNIQQPNDLFRLVVFLLEGVVLCLLMSELHAARRRAEWDNQAKDRILAVVSHELRNPINPLLLTTTALLDDPETPARLRRGLELIRRTIQLEARLIDDLLDVARIIRGKEPPFRWEVVDAHAVVAHAVEDSRGEAEAKGIALRVDLAATQRHLRADPARLQQVLWNLLKNAVKFTPGGGSITVATRNRAEGSGIAVEWVLSVSDTGPGIAPDVLERIFLPYEQAPEGAAPRYGGLGLGLAISRSIVEAHGGRLTAVSDGPGRGATFVVALATTSPADPAPAAPIPSGPSHRAAGLRILLVEDDALTRQVMIQLLSESGHEVIAAESCATTQALVGGGPPSFDLVICDIGLPDGSGLDLMRRLRARRPIPGIAVSGYGMDEDVARSREAGFVAHLTKPIDFPTLDGVIQRVASGAGTVGEAGRPRSAGPSPAAR